MLLVEDRLAAAKDHIAAGRRDSAGLILEGIVDINPGHAESLRLLAEIRVTQGRPDDGLQLAAVACRREPQDRKGLALLARIALLAGQSEIAVAAIDGGLLLDDNDADLSMLKATLLIAAGDFAAAERRLAVSLDRHPDHAGLLSTLAQLYGRTGTMAPALQYAQQALELEPDNAAILAQLGTHLADLADHERAVPYLEKAHLLDPADPNVVARLGQSLVGTGNLTEAQRATDRLVALYPDFLPGWQVWGTAMIYRGEADAALSRLGPVAKAHSERVPALLLLAGLYRIAGRAEDALRLVDPLIPRLPQLDLENRRKALTLIRDCCLTTGAFDRLREILAPRDPDATENGEPTEEPDVPILPVVIEPGLSPLEIIPLLRFCRSGDQQVDIRGPGSIAELVGLMPGLNFAANDVPRDAPITETIEAVPLTSLLLRRGQDIAPLSAPYLRPSGRSLQIWCRSLQSLPRPLLGISWDEHRPGLVLDDLAPMLADFAGSLVSLCWDGGRPQLAAWPKIIDAGRHFSGLDDVAAVIAHLDGVLGTDSLPLHIAGAMGIRGALITQPNFSWYWYGTEGRSAWYPSIEILQTAGLGHWSTRIGDIEQRIGTFVEGLAAMEHPET